MQWLDLSAYGGIKLKVRSRTPDPAVMFVLDGGDAIATALDHAAFSRTRSGLWSRSFEPADCVEILSSLVSDLPLAMIRDMEPAEILQEYQLPVFEPLIVESEVSGSPGNDLEANGEAIGSLAGHSLGDNDPSSELPPDAVSRGTSADRQGADVGDEISCGDALSTPRTVSLSPHSGSAENPMAIVMAALAALAASTDVDAGCAAVMDESSGGGDPMDVTAKTVLDVEADTIFEVECAWVVSADVSDVRDLTGLKQLADRNHLIAKLAARGDARAAARWVGMLAKIAPDEPAVRIVAVVRGIDGSGFGGPGDFLLVGDPGEGVGPLLEHAGAEDVAAA